MGSGLRNTFQPRSDIDAVAHQVAVAFLDHIAKMDADAELDAALGWQARVALDHPVLHLDGTAHRVHHTAELDEDAIAGAFYDVPIVHRDGWIDQIAPQCPEPRQRAIFFRARKPAVSDHIGRQYCREFPGLLHNLPPQIPARRQILGRPNIGKDMPPQYRIPFLVHVLGNDQGTSPIGP